MKITLKAARVNAGLRQADVAKILGVHSQRIKYLEGPGAASITYKDLTILCDIYGCTPDDIFLPINFPKSEGGLGEHLDRV